MNTDAILELARQKLDYNPETGALTWSENATRHVRPGDDAGYLDRNGYVIVSLRQRKYMGHVLAWALYHGRWPTGRVRLKSDRMLAMEEDRRHRRSDLRLSNLEHVPVKLADNGNAERQRRFRIRKETHERKDRPLFHLGINLALYPGLTWNGDTLRWEVRDDVDRAELIPGFPTTPRLHLTTIDLTEAYSLTRDLDFMQSFLLDNPPVGTNPDWATGTLPIGAMWTYVDDLLAYDPKSGVFIHRTGPDIGTRADTKYATTNQRRVIIDGFRYPADRMAWFLSKGTYPDAVIHLDGNPGNNAIANLSLPGS